MLEAEYYFKVCWLKANPGKTARIARSIEERMPSWKIEKQSPVALMPLMLNARETALVKYTSQVLYRAIHKTIKASFSSPQIQKYFCHEELPREWVETEPGYENYALVAKLDALYNGNDLKYIEFNTDNPGGQALADILHSAFVKHPYYQSLISAPQAAPKIREYSVKAIKSIYRDIQPKDRGVPSIAFVNYEDAPDDPEINSAIGYFNQNGLNAFLADPRRFQIRKGQVYVGEKRVDIVRRQMKAQEFLKHRDQLKSFEQGYVKHNFCMVNSFRAVYGSEKSILSLMTRPDFHHIYDKEEKKVIERHLPWTRQMSERETKSPGGKKVEISAFLKKNRKRMVLKPSWGYGGKDVFLGGDMTQEDWEKLVDQRLGDKDWIAQRFVSIPQIPAPFLTREGKVLVRKKYFNLNSFVVDGRFAGMLGRYSDSPVISVDKGGAILPVLQY